MTKVSHNLDEDCFCYVPGFLPWQSACALQGALEDDVAWHQEHIQLFGRRVQVPRSVAWYGDAGLNYSYSNTPHLAAGWSPALAELRDAVAAYSGARYNFALLNRYDDGGCYMGWHSDAEAVLGDAPTIASVSLGATRRFRVRSKRPTNERRATMAGAVVKTAQAPQRTSTALDLEHGSLLLMRGASQRDYEHCLTKTRRRVDGRINLTFRYVHDSVVSR